MSIKTRATIEDLYGIEGKAALPVMLYCVGWTRERVAMTGPLAQWK